MRHRHSLSFLGGVLSIDTENGEGTLSFPEEEVVIDNDCEGGPRAMIAVPLDELREMHAWLGERLAQIDKSV